MNKRLRHIVLISILAALAIILSIVDKYISSVLFATIPGAKIGLANLIILISISNFDFKDSLIIAILKSLIAGLLFGGFTSFIIGGTATILSLVMMYLIKKTIPNKVSYVGISMVGGFVHTFIQLVVILLLYNMGIVVFAYGLPLFIISMCTSIILGFLTLVINIRYQNVLLNNNN